MNRQNRNVKAAFETAMASNGMKLVDIVEPTRSDWMESLAVAAPPALLGFFTGVSWGKVLTAADIVLFPGVNDNLVAAAMGFSLAYVTYTGVFRFYLLHTAAHYYAEKGEAQEQEEKPDGFIQTARTHERKRITGRMRSLLHVMAQNYEEIATLAVIPWYESKYLNRSQIEDVRDYMVNIGAANRDGRGVVTLSEWGGRQLAKWRLNDFSDVIELVNSPLPSEAA